MKKILFLFAIMSLITLHSTHAQTDDVPENKRAVKASVGFATTTPYDEDVETFGKGFSIQGEYIYKAFSWLDVRPYAGYIFAKTAEEDNEPNEAGFKSDMNAFLLGGKLRLKAPIPWVAPFIEVGIGMSVGKFETFTNTTNIQENGMLFHIPVSLGLELGRHHNFEIMLSYYYHNGAEQFAGAAAFGVTFPLN